MKRGEQRALLIAGPTASGKSALALKLAGERNGIVVNADALQVYEGLRVLTARPSEADMGAVPHRLYGFVAPGLRFSTGAWLAAARGVIAEAAGAPASSARAAKAAAARKRVMTSSPPSGSCL